MPCHALHKHAARRCGRWAICHRHDAEAICRPVRRAGDRRGERQSRSVTGKRASASVCSQPVPTQVDFEASAQVDLTPQRGFPLCAESHINSNQPARGDVLSGKHGLPFNQAVLNGPIDVLGCRLPASSHRQLRRACLCGDQRKPVKYLETRLGAINRPERSAPVGIWRSVTQALASLVETSVS